MRFEGYLVQSWKLARGKVDVGSCAVGKGHVPLCTYKGMILTQSTGSHVN